MWRTVGLKLIEAATLALAALAFFSHYGKLTLGAELSPLVFLYQAVTQGSSDFVMGLVPIGGIEITPEESDLLWFNGLLFLPIFREGVSATGRVRSVPGKVLVSALAVFYLIVWVGLFYSCMTDEFDAKYLQHLTWYDYGSLLVGFLAMGVSICHVGLGKDLRRPLVFASHYVGAASGIWALNAIGAVELNFDPLPFQLPF